MSKPTPPKKLEEKTESQNPTIKIPEDLKTVLEEMKSPDESIADVVRRLVKANAINAAPSDGLVVHKMTPELSTWIGLHIPDEKSRTAFYKSRVMTAKV